ncbi:MAG: hypothetical protein EAZ53_00090 [Bacteroidetes bacterium]|nr:MAG: hypothetical protein EAZ53_00090 [Bacteroidota bacterium]
MKEDMKKDNIESLFKKSLEHYEELPTKDLWAKISEAIPVYDTASNAALSQAATATKATSAIVSLKVAIISSAVVLGVIGTYFWYAYLSFDNTTNQTKTTKSMVDAVDSAAFQPLKEKNTVDYDVVADTKVEKKAVAQNTKIVPQPFSKAETSITNKSDSTIVKKERILADTLRENIILENKKTIEPIKKESFFEKNAKKLKDSTRSVFTPE